VDQNLKKYRIVDLVFLSIFAGFAEVLTNVAQKQVAFSGYILNFSMLVTVIAMIRWGRLGAIPYGIAGIVSYFFRITTTDISQYIGIDYIETFFYDIIPNFFVFISLLPFIKITRTKIVKNNLMFASFILMAFIIVAFLKGVIATLFGTGFVVGSVDYLMYNIFSIILTIIIAILLKRRKGLINDQTLIKEQKEIHDGN